MISPSLRDRPNVVPGAYRGVSLAEVDVPLSGGALRRHFIGRPAYRRTRFVVVRSRTDLALMQVDKESTEPLFSPITALEVLAEPHECRYVRAPDADTAVPSELARIAAEQAPRSRAVVVEGRYAHVNFIINPAPLRVRVHELVPPRPAKLVDQVRRLLSVAEHLPPMMAEEDSVGFDELAAQRPSSRYLLPCKGSDVTVGSAPVAYLDQHPAREDWTLIGCARSVAIHESFYGDRPPVVDLCPRNRRSGPEQAVLTKCCLLEERIEREDGRMVVPWGASLEQVSAALTELARIWRPAWRPA